MIKFSLTELAVFAQLAENIGSYPHSAELGDVLRVLPAAVLIESSELVALFDYDELFEIAEFMTDGGDYLVLHARDDYQIVHYEQMDILTADLSDADQELIWERGYEEFYGATLTVVGDYCFICS